jgi:hypothetical protein
VNNDGCHVPLFMRLFGTLTEAPARLSRVLSWRLLPLCCLRRNSRDTRTTSEEGQRVR